MSPHFLKWLWLALPLNSRVSEMDSHRSDCPSVATTNRTDRSTVRREAKQRTSHSAERYKTGVIIAPVVELSLLLEVPRLIERPASQSEYLLSSLLPGPIVLVASDRCRCGQTIAVPRRLSSSCCRVDAICLQLSAGRGSRRTFRGS